MSFRARLFWSLALAVLVGTAVEAVLDYVDMRQRITSEMSRALELALADVAATLERGAPRDATLLTGLPPNSHLRLLDGERVLLELGATGPSLATLASGRRQLGDGTTLEIVVDATFFRRLLEDSFRNDLLDDFAQVGLSVAIAWVLASLLLHPIRALTDAADDLSRQRFPEPVKVPPGRDELAQLARSFNRMTASIQAAIDRERTFTRYASHELRTPLAAMKLRLETLELGIGDPAEAVPALTRNLERMQRVLEALLSLARAAEQSPAPVEVAALVREAVAVFPDDARKRVRIVDRLRDPVEVANPYLVSQAVLNLVDNALKYSDAEVTLHLEPRDAGIEIRISDQGPGVPEEMIDKLTNTFFRLSSHVDGSGLGLAFVKHIVRTFGGELGLRNTARGLEATLVLPSNALA